MSCLTQPARRFRLRILCSLVLGVLLASPAMCEGVRAQTEPQPTPDRLAIPVLPDNPTQTELGKSVYYYNCMPCHGDRGQGLTEEWRQAWVEDHQNCWDRGCHGGRVDDEGFPIPRYVPAVSARQDTLQGYPTPGHLFHYLQQTHPPQRPGVLAEEDYWAVTAYLLLWNNRLEPQQVIGLVQEGISLPPAAALVIFFAVTTGIGALMICQARLSAKG